MAAIILFMLIYLVGYMASGKSAFGRVLAGKLGFSFIDMDEWIANEAGISISEYFASRGEDAFRLHEQKLLRYVSMSERTVVATGGGTPCFFENMDLMNATGHTVWLDVPFEILIHRLANESEQRPVLAGAIDLKALVENQLMIRIPYYQRAKQHLNSNVIDEMISQVRLAIGDRRDL